MRSYSIIISVIMVQSCCISASSPSSAGDADSAIIRSDGRHQRTNRDTDGSADDRSDAYDGHRTVSKYHHISDGTSSAADGGGWIIGNSRRRAVAGNGAHKYHQDKPAFGEPEVDKRREPEDKWPAVVAGPDAASSLSEVQVVVHQSPHRNSVDDQNQQQQPSASSSTDVASKWYSKRLSYATKTSSAAVLPSSLQQPEATVASNAILLAEVLGQKSGFNTTAGKGYYGGPAAVQTGSKGFQNDLMDMLGKSMCAEPVFCFFYYRLVVHWEC